MKIEELRAYLLRHQVPDELYVIQELGIGEVEGIGFLDGEWTTYYSERGQYRNRETYPSEDAAVEAFLGRMRRLMLRMHGKHLP